ncbi:MAG: DUF5348 domain-containing protein [Elusimicrobiota bacterium]|jgi:hypothetical protein
MTAAAVVDWREAILEKSIADRRYRLAHWDIELRSGDALSVYDRDHWEPGRVEYSHDLRAYYFTEPLDCLDGLVTLAQLAEARVLVRECLP